MSKYVTVVGQTGEVQSKPKLSYTKAGISDHEERIGGEELVLLGNNSS